MLKDFSTHTLALAVARDPKALIALAYTCNIWLGTASYRDRTLVGVVLSFLPWLLLGSAFDVLLRRVSAVSPVVLSLGWLLHRRVTVVFLFAHVIVFLFAMKVLANVFHVI